MTIDEIKEVCFVGAGTMGCYNSLISALTGYKVILYDILEESLVKAQEHQRNWGPTFQDYGICSPEDIENVLTKITYTTDPEEAARNADFLSESVFEQLDLKRKIHRQFDGLLPLPAIMTTNTSTLLVSDIESVVKRGDKFAAVHFHQRSPLVDIVKGPRTTDNTIDIIKRFIKSQGQLYVVLKKEREGYLHNALFGSLLTTSILMSIFQKVDFRDVDRAWMINQKSDRGPFGMIDSIGLNVIFDIFEEVSKDEEKSNPEISKAIHDFFYPYIDNNNLGIKTGKGFYSYPDPEFQQSDFLTGREENENLSQPLVNGLLSTALTLVAEGYTDIEDVDRSWMLTHNPKSGPFGVIDQVGLDVVKNNLEEKVKQMDTSKMNPDSVLANINRQISILEPFIEKGDLGTKTSKGFYTYPNPDYENMSFLGIEKGTLFRKIV